MIQTFDEYREQAAKTRFTCGIMYAAVALGGEAGEVLNEVKKWYRDDNQTLTNERRDKLVGELGDVLWYLDMMAQELGLPLRTVAEKNIEKLHKRYLESNRKAA